MYSDDDEKIQAASCLALMLLRRRQRRRFKKKRIWVKEWIKKRDRYGAINNLLQELRDGDAWT